MGRTLIALALVGTITAVEVCVADDVDFEQTVRAASRFEAIAQVCPALIPTDASKARVYANVYTKAAERFASDRLAEMMPAEIERRLNEVEKTGAQRWCEDQRRYLNEVGGEEIFPTAKPPSKR